MSPEITQQLVELGVSEREAKIYLALLNNTEANAGTLHRQTGISRPRTYSVLAKMVTRGLCIERRAGHNLYYRAVKPEDVLTSLRAHWEEEYNSKSLNAEKVFSTLSEKHEDYSSKIMDFLEVLKDSQQIHKRYLDLVYGCSDEIMSFIRPPFAASSQKMLNEQLEAQKTVLERGVRFRTIQALEEFRPSKSEDELLQPLASNDQGRRVTRLPMKMFIFDRKKVMMAMPSNPFPGTAATMILIEDEGYLEFCIRSFETYWAEAKPL